MKRIIIVDDNELFAQSLAEGIRRLTDFHVAVVPNGREALSRLRHEKTHLVITDLQMPVMGGVELIASLWKTHPDTPVIIMTAYGTERMVEMLEDTGISWFLEKPFKLETLALLTKKILKSHTPEPEKTVHVSQ